MLNFKRPVQLDRMNLTQHRALSFFYDGVQLLLSKRQEPLFDIEQEKKIGKRLGDMKLSYVRKNYITDQETIKNAIFRLHSDYFMNVSRRCDNPALHSYLSRLEEELG